MQQDGACESSVRRRQGARRQLCAGRGEHAATISVGMLQDKARKPEWKWIITRREHCPISMGMLQWQGKGVYIFPPGATCPSVEHARRALSRSRLAIIVFIILTSALLFPMPRSLSASCLP